MKRTGITRLERLLAGGSIAAMLSVSVAIASPVSTNTPPTGWLADSSESDISDNVSFVSMAGGGIQIAFAAQAGMPTYAVGTIVADAGSPDSPFAGDYVAAGVKALEFRIAGDGHTPMYPMAMLVGQSGRR